MKKPVLIAIVIAVVFGAAFAAFGLMAPHLWNSPDETAVAYFVKSFSTMNRLWVVEPYNIFGPGVVHPRSIIALGDYMVPAFFYGSIYFFGTLAN